MDSTQIYRYFSSRWFVPEMFQWRRGTKGVGVLPQEFFFTSSYEFKPLKWPILTEMTVNYEILFSFSLTTRGGGGMGAVWGRTP